MESMKNVRGFTLIELMITLAVAAILITAALPSFNEFIKNNRLTTQANNFIATLNLARSEAPARITLRIGFADLGHIEPRHDSRSFALALQTILQRQCVHDRGKHTHVITGYPVKPGCRQAGTAEQVTAAHHDAEFHSTARQRNQLGGSFGDHLRINPGFLFAHQGLTAEFYQDTFVFDFRHRSQICFD